MIRGALSHGVIGGEVQGGIPERGLLTGHDGGERRERSKPGSSLQLIKWHAVGSNLNQMFQSYDLVRLSWQNLAIKLMAFVAASATL